MQLIRLWLLWNMFVSYLTVQGFLLYVSRDLGVIQWNIHNLADRGKSAAGPIRANALSIFLESRKWQEKARKHYYTTVTEIRLRFRWSHVSTRCWPVLVLNRTVFFLHKTCSPSSWIHTCFYASFTQKYSREKQSPNYLLRIRKQTIHTVISAGSYCVPFSVASSLFFYI